MRCFSCRQCKQLAIIEVEIFEVFFAFFTIFLTVFGNNILMHAIPGKLITILLELFYSNPDSA